MAVRRAKRLLFCRSVSTLYKTWDDVRGNRRMSYSGHVVEYSQSIFHVLEYNLLFLNEGNELAIMLIYSFVGRIRRNPWTGR